MPRLTSGEDGRAWFSRRLDRKRWKVFESVVRALRRGGMADQHGSTEQRQADVRTTSILGESRATIDEFRVDHVTPWREGSSATVTVRGRSSIGSRSAATSSKPTRAWPSSAIRLIHAPRGPDQAALPDLNEIDIFPEAPPSVEAMLHPAVPASSRLLG